MQQELARSLVVGPNASVGTLTSEDFFGTVVDYLKVETWGYLDFQNSWSPDSRESRRQAIAQRSSGRPDRGKLSRMEPFRLSWLCGSLSRIVMTIETFSSAACRCLVCSQAMYAALETQNVPVCALFLVSAVICIVYMTLIRQSILAVSLNGSPDHHGGW